MTLTVVTPSKKILSDAEVDDVFVPAYRGELNILPGHAALISTLGTGTLRFREKGVRESNEVAISWGYLEVFKDRITVLAETAEKAGEIDVERAKAAKERAEKELLRPDLEHHHFQKYQAKLERAVTRIQVATKPSVS